ncbi:MAG TPA: lipoate--protein ligase family protein [Opitutaceae bacterium]
MILDLLPTRTGGAAENMAADFLLLQRYPDEGRARFRHYEWRRPAFTFGFAQKIAFVRAQLPADEPVDLCRRPTGGGVVDHREDWTYALVIPRGHALYDLRATQSYRVVHACIADALRALGQPVVLKEHCEPECATASAGGGGNDFSAAEPAPTPGVCFTRAELYDVLNEATGAKVAGAAQKRTKHGLLFQGSIWRPAVGALDWDVFHDAFAQRLAVALAAEAAPCGWPEISDDELNGLTEQYASPEWIEYR